MRPPVILCPPRLTCFSLVPSSVCVCVCVTVFAPCLHSLFVISMSVLLSLVMDASSLVCFLFLFSFAFVYHLGRPLLFPIHIDLYLPLPLLWFTFLPDPPPIFFASSPLFFLLVGTSPPLPLLLSRSARTTSTEELKHASARTHTPYMHIHVRIQLIIPIVITTIITKTIKKIRDGVKDMQTR